MDGSGVVNETTVGQDNIETAQDTYMLLGLLAQVGKKVGSVTKLGELITNIIRMTQHAIRASASSVLLFDDEGQELFFEMAEGQAQDTLKQIRLNTQTGIAGWVAKNGKPLMINDVSGDSRFNKRIDEVTGFTTESIICVPLLTHCKTIGVVEVLNKVGGKGFSRQDLETLVSVASTSAMAIENAKLQQNVLDSYKSTVKALAAAIEAKDPYTCGHSQRVMQYALLGGTLTPCQNDDLMALEYAGILHDIGKIGISDSILTKPGSLTPEEWDKMRNHPIIGANILSEIPFLSKVREFILYHHERYDGNGYPDGLKGDDIPLGSRLLAVADAFDTMTTDRSYRAALSVDYAVEELHRCAGTQFCPVAVDALVSGLQR